MAIDTSAFDRFKKAPTAKTVDLSAFGKDQVELPAPAPKPKGLVTTVASKLPEYLSTTYKDYIAKESARNLSLPEQFKDSFVDKPAAIVKFLAQGVAGGVVGLGRSIMETSATMVGKKDEVREMFDRGKNYDQILFGGEVDTYQEITEKINEFVNKSPDATEFEKKYLAPALGLGLFAADAFPGKPNIKKLTSELIEDVAKSTDPTDITARLVKFGIPEETATKLAPKLVEATTPQTVRQALLDEGGKQLTNMLRVVDPDAVNKITTTVKTDVPTPVVNKRQQVIDASPKYLQTKVNEKGYFTENRYVDSAYPKTFTSKVDIEDLNIKSGDRFAVIETSNEGRPQLQIIFDKPKITEQNVELKRQSVFGDDIQKVEEAIADNVPPTKPTGTPPVTDLPIRSKASDIKPKRQMPEKATNLEPPAPEEQQSVRDLIRRDQGALRSTRATGITDSRNLRREMEDNINRYNKKIPDKDIVKIREENLLGPETIDEIIARKRGIITDAEAIERAKKIQGTLQDVIDLPKGTTVTKEQYTAIEQIIQNEREINNALRQAFDAGSTSAGRDERALLKNLGPEYVDKTDEEILRLALQESTTKLKKAEIVLLGIRSEAGRTLQATKQYVEGVDNRLRILFGLINKNKKLDEVAKEAMVETIIKMDTSDNKAFLKALDELVKPDIFDKAAEWSVAAKLWNPTTHIVNLGGNAIRQLVDISVKAGTNPMAIKADLQGAIHGFKIGVRNAIKVLTNDGYAQQLSKYVESGGDTPAIGGKLGVTVRTPFRLLSSGDEIFRNMAYQRKLHRDAYKIVKKEKLTGNQLNRRMEELLNAPTFKMMEDATEEAKRLTFQEDMGEITSQINRFRDPGTYETAAGKTVGVVARLFLPFLKTPVNLFKQSVDFSPVGIIKNSAAFKKAMKEGDTEKMGTIIGEAVLGSALIAYIALEAMEGNVTGGAPLNPAERDRFYRENKLPYAIKFNDTWYQYQRLDPLALIMGMTADLTRSEDASIGGLAITMSQNLQDKTYLSGVSDLMKMLTGEEWEREQAIKSALLGAAFPSFVGHIARSYDPTVRVADTITERLIAQTPGLSESLPARVNVLGYDVERANKGLNYFFNPIQSVDAGLDPITKELMAIDKSISIPNKTFQRNDVKYNLNAEEYEDFARYTGIKVRTELEKLFKTPKYQRADTEKKYDLIDEIRTEAMDEWKDEYVREKEEKNKRILEVFRRARQQ